MDRRLTLLFLFLIVLGLIAFYPIKYSIISYVKDVPVQVGYDPAQNFWILTAVVNEKEAFKLTLHANQTYSTRGDTALKASSEVAIVIEPKQPFSTTGLTELTTQFVSSKTVAWLGYSFVPGKDVDDTSWLTTAAYRLTALKNGAEKTSMDVFINYKEPKFVTIPVEGYAVEVDNLGMIPQGVEVPSGDLVVVQDGRTGKPAQHIWMKADLNSMVQSWNVDGTYWAVSGSWSWQDVLNWAEQRGKLPQDVPLVHVYNTDIQETQIKLTYGDIVFAGFITVKIPAALADTVTIQQYTPKPQIVSVNPTSISVKEGEYADLTVVVKNVGTEGTVSVSATSAIADIIPTSPSSIIMKEGETHTFTFKVLGREVDASKSSDITILAQGRGGSDTRTLTVSVENVVRSTGGEGGGEAVDLSKLFGGFNLSGALLGLGAFFFILILAVVALVLFWFFGLPRRRE